MRIISQDGTIDVPYETSILHIVTSTKAEYSKSFIFCTPNNSMDSNELARYSTKAKSQKAMEMLHDSYDNFEWIKTTGSSDELKALCKHITKEDFKALTSPYFQFPQDEDVEV